MRWRRNVNVNQNDVLEGLRLPKKSIQNHGDSWAAASCLPHAW